MKLKSNLVAKITLNSKRYMLRPTRVKMQTDSFFYWHAREKRREKEGKGKEKGGGIIEANF